MAAYRLIGCMMIVALACCAGCQKNPFRRGDGNAESSREQAAILNTRPARELVAYHTVEAGETLSTIARKYNASAWRIAIDNNLGKGNLIYPGQRLRIMSDARNGEDGPYVTETRAKRTD